MTDLRQQRNMIWMAMRNLMLQVDNNGGAMTKAQAAAFDHLYVDLNRIDDELRTGVSADNPWGLASPAPCACGYDSECAVWCGDGHETGKCEQVGVMGQLRQAKQEMRRMDADYENYKELYATTGEQGYYDKMLECVYIT